MYACTSTTLSKSFSLPGNCHYHYCIKTVERNIVTFLLQLNALYKYREKEKLLLVIKSADSSKTTTTAITTTVVNGNITEYECELTAAGAAIANTLTAQHT